MGKRQSGTGRGGSRGEQGDKGGRGGHGGGSSRVKPREPVAARVRRGAANTSRTQTGTGAGASRLPQSGTKQAKPAIRPFETFEATFLGMPEGLGGFLRPAGATRADGLDMFVDWRDASGAIHGDTVLAEAEPPSQEGRLRGRVVEVRARTVAPIPATLQAPPKGYGKNRPWRALPLDPRMQQVVSVPPTDLAQDGDYVTVLLNPDTTPGQLKGTVRARLGRPSDLKIENRLTAAMFNIRTDFPTAVFDALAPFPTRIPDEWLPGREDLRHTLTVTIDPPTAKDFDDAISLEPLPEEEGGGWELGVHIADVSHYVTESGPLDMEAQLRGTSVYFPDECIPMLPDRLSSELCSLVEGHDRLTMTALLTISDGLEIVGARFSESVIRSSARLSYDQVKEACLDLDGRARHLLGSDICEMLDQALVLSRRLTEKRLGRGALDLDTDETEFIFDKEGRPIDAGRHDRHDAHRMIEEFMLLANEAVARHFSRKRIPTIYRVHDEPDPLKLDAFKTLAVSFALMRPKDSPTPERLNALLKKIQGGPLETILNTMLLRSLKRAEYSARNIGHSGLALKDYLHFTSPIRRYPDLVVHRLLKKNLHKEIMPDWLQGHLTTIAKRASDCEQQATEAERENSKWKACLLMKDKIGVKFSGTVQGFSAKAAFIRLESPFVEVGAPLGSLGGGFSVDEQRTRATGRGGRVVLAIGAKAVVEITSVDEKMRRVSAVILEAAAEDARGKAIKFVPTLLGPTTLREADFVVPAMHGARKGRGKKE